MIVPAAGLALQLLLYRWSFIRGNRRIALRVLHAMTLASLSLCLVCQFLFQS